MAGVAALYISKHGGRAQHGKGFAKMLHARIAASGSSMTWPGNSGDGSSHLASPSQIGNGLINALKVLEYETQLSMTKFSLNDTLHFSRYQKVDSKLKVPDAVTNALNLVQFLHATHCC